MKVNIEIPDYDPKDGIKYKWTENFEIKVIVKDREVLILGNKEGLVSLANHLLNLAQEGISSGNHMHFDEHNSLEQGSLGLIIQKT